MHAKLCKWTGLTFGFALAVLEFIMQVMIYEGQVRYSVNNSCTPLHELELVPSEQAPANADLEWKAFRCVSLRPCTSHVLVVWQQSAV